jgi:LacI family transcriptional regulator
VGDTPPVARRATLKDIAASVGLSVNTVSRALAGKDAVSEQTRAVIQAEADRLGYVPNAMARSLVVGSAMALGLVITNPSNPFYATLISAIEQRGRLHGYSLVLMVTEESLENERRAVEALLRWGVDGAIVVPVQQGAEHWKRLQAARMPLVLANRDLPELDCDFVGIDFEGGAYTATRHLLDAGVRRVHLLEEDLAISSVTDRIAGFRRALAEHDVPQDTIIRVPTRRWRASALPWDPGDAYHLAQRLVRTIQPGSAIMVGNDYFALGVYRALIEAGRSIPGEIAVMGYGDHPFSAYLNPPLTSVRLPAGEIGASAVDLLVRRLQGQRKAGQPEKIRLAPTLVVRASTTGVVPGR